MAKLELDRILAKLAERAVRAGYPLARCTIGLLSNDGSALVLVAVWGPASEAVHAGVRFSVAATPFPEVVRTGATVFSHQAEETLADRVVRAEGIGSWVVVPVWNELGLPVGLVSFSSVRSDAFPETSQTFFETLASDAREAVLAFPLDS